MKRIASTFLATFALAATLPSGVLAQEAQPEKKQENSGQVFAKVLHTSAGETLENVMVVFTDGKITAITPGASPGSDDVQGAVLTAGMIDMSARVTSASTAVEQTNEVESRLSVANSLNLYSRNWKNLARTGVTTVLATPPDRNVVGGLSAILKTQGPMTMAERQLEGRNFLRGAMGDAPSSGNRPAFGAPRSVYNRRPTTRMGVEWEWRSSFFDAAAALEYPELEFPGADVFRAVLAGSVTLYVQAFNIIDVRTAVFLKEELKREGFGEIQMWIDGGAEAWKDAQVLKRSETGVVLPPFPSAGYAREFSFMAWRVAKDLHEMQIPFALSAHGATSPGRTLADQAGRAIRGGLPFEQALAAVTSVPANALGLQDRIGTVEVGKDADLVLWSGAPFELTSRVQAVWVSGESATPAPKTESSQK